MAPDNKVKRKVLFLKHPLQNQYILHILIGAVLPMSVLFCNVYLLIWISVTNHVGAGNPGLIAAFEKANSLFVLEIPLMLIFLLLWAIYISHRLVGPLLRLEMDLNRILSGEHGLRIQLRESDQKDIKNIVENINSVLELKTRNINLN